jgi:hypothetical protein
MIINTVDEWNVVINRCANCYGDSAPAYPDDPPQVPPQRHSCSMNPTAPGIFEAQMKSSGTWDTCGEADSALAEASWGDIVDAGTAFASMESSEFFCSKTAMRYRVRIPDSFTGSWVYETWDELFTTDGGATGTLTPKSWTWESPDSKTSDWSPEIVPSSNGDIVLRNGYAQITHGTIYGAKPNRSAFFLWP